MHLGHRLVVEKNKFIDKNGISYVEQQQPRQTGNYKVSYFQVVRYKVRYNDEITNDKMHNNVVVINGVFPILDHLLRSVTQ